jgi:hypothetical protein
MMGLPPLSCEKKLPCEVAMPRKPRLPPRMAPTSLHVRVLDRRLDRDVVPVQVRQVGPAQLAQRGAGLVEVVEQAQYAFDGHASLE